MSSKFFGNRLDPKQTNKNSGKGSKKIRSNKAKSQGIRKTGRGN
ncbi:MAG: hypothetical protein VX325_05925 [Bacteroidota bacterium]|nr:hypothetical protein [Bacteroidota bacterium]